MNVERGRITLAFRDSSSSRPPVTFGQQFYQH